MSTRAIRGATSLRADNADEMTEVVVELLEHMLNANDALVADVISVLFTATPDLHCKFPAAATRGRGWDDVPLICSQELDITDAMPRVVRIMMHIESTRTRADIEHVYLRGTHVLRQDRDAQ